MIEKMRDKTKPRNKEKREIPLKQLELRDARQFPQLRPVLEDRQVWKRNDSNTHSTRVEVIQKDREVNKNVQHGENDFKDFLALIEEIKKLNAKFNIKNMLKSVKILNEQLEKCNNQVEKFQVFVEFCQTLESTCIN